MLVEPKAKQLEKSPGAGLADPISLFGEKGDLKRNYKTDPI